MEDDIDWLGWLNNVDCTNAARGDFTCDGMLPNIESNVSVIPVLGNPKLYLILTSTTLCSEASSEFCRIQLPD